ncbi:hypothetical protein HN51_037366 [Arachis hypogaea]
MVEEWIKANDLYFQENGNLDCMVLDTSSVNSMPIRPLNDEAEDLGEGFDDHEIFSCGKDGEDENTGDKLVNQ